MFKVGDRVRVKPGLEARGQEWPLEPDRVYTITSTPSIFSNYNTYAYLDNVTTRSFKLDRLEPAPPDMHVLYSMRKGNLRYNICK